MRCAGPAPKAPLCTALRSLQDCTPCNHCTAYRSTRHPRSCQTRTGNRRRKPCRWRTSERSSFLCRSRFRHGSQRSCSCCRTVRMRPKCCMRIRWGRTSPSTRSCRSGTSKPPAGRSCKSSLRTKCCRQQRMCRIRCSSRRCKLPHLGSRRCEDPRPLARRCRCRQIPERCTPCSRCSRSASRYSTRRPRSCPSCTGCPSSMATLRRSCSRNCCLQRSTSHRGIPRQFPPCSLHRR